MDEDPTPAAEPLTAKSAEKQQTGYRADARQRADEDQRQPTPTTTTRLANATFNDTVHLGDMEPNVEKT